MEYYLFRSYRPLPPVPPSTDEILKMAHGMRLQVHKDYGEKIGQSCVYTLFKQSQNCFELLGKMTQKTKLKADMIKEEIVSTPDPQTGTIGQLMNFYMYKSLEFHFLRDGKIFMRSKLDPHNPIKIDFESSRYYCASKTII